MCFLNIKACQHILLHQIHKIMIFKKASYDPFKEFNSFREFLLYVPKNIKINFNWEIKKMAWKSLNLSHCM